MEVVVSHHLNVEVIIPGNEAVMTYSPDQRTATEPVGYLVLAADLIDHHQNLQHAKLVLPQLGAVGVEALAQCLMVNRCCLHIVSFVVPTVAPRPW